MRRLSIVTLVMAWAATLPAAAAPDFYVPDVVSQFRSITDRADALGFGIGPSVNPDTCRHYQGMARSHGAGTPYLFVTKSGNKPDGVPACLELCDAGGVPVPCTSVGDDYGQLLVVRMGSRDTDGERLRSNRLRRNTDTDESVPDPADVVVTAISLDGTDGWPSYGHPGGVQLIDDVLAIAIEKPYAPEYPETAVLFVDVSNPEQPRPLSLLPVEGVFTGDVAIARELDGRFLMLLTGGSNSVVHLYRSSGTDLKTVMDWTFLDDWTGTGNILGLSDDEIVLGRPWPLGSSLNGAYQTLNFVREGGPDGPLYMIGARDTNGGLPLGDDEFDLFRVDWQGEEFKPVWVGARHVNATASSDGSVVFETRLASFAAATGVYVSPSGELILYAIEHENDGPSVGGIGTVKVAEFRHRWGVRYGSPTLDPSVEPGGPYRVAEGGSVPLAASSRGPATKAWAQLWADPDWDDRYVVVDYADRHADDFDDFEDLDDANLNPLAEGFGDQASSVAWYAPLGCTIFLQEHEVESGGSPGNVLPLESAGIDQTGFRPDLDGSGFDDEISSVRFGSDCDAYYAATMAVDWDLDGDAVFETAGAGATFSALLLDGPTAIDAGVRAVHPTDGRIGTARAAIEVFNVAPSVSVPELRDPSGRLVGTEVPFLVAALPATLAASFTDPGRPDTHVAEVAWGDGAVTSQGGLASFVDSTGGGVGSLGAGHRYATAGTVSVLVAVTDDDDGVGTASMNVQVAGPAEMLRWVVSRIDLLLAGSWDPRVESALARARTHLDNALAFLERDGLNSAMAQLVAAVVALEEAESFGGPDVSDMTSGVALAAYSIAQTTYDGAAATPSSTTARRLERSAAALADGARWVAVPDDAQATRSFQESVRQVVPVNSTKGAIRSNRLDGRTRLGGGKPSTLGKR